MPASIEEKCCGGKYTWKIQRGCIEPICIIFSKSPGKTNALEGLLYTYVILKSGERHQQPVVSSNGLGLLFHLAISISVHQPECEEG